MVNWQPTSRRAAMAAGVALVLGGCVGQPAGVQEPSGDETIADPYGLYDVLDANDAKAILNIVEMWEVEAGLSDRQLGDLSDGRVTEDECRGAFERYRSCLRDAGFEVESIQVDGSFMSYGIPDAAVQSGVDDECYIGEFFATEYVWTSTNVDESEWRSKISGCVNRSGIDISTESGHPPTVTELEQLLIEAGIDPESCS